MESLYFVIAAVALYFLADFLLDRIEVWLGRRLESRTIVFLFLLLGLALTTFWLFRRFVPGAGPAAG